VQNRLFGLKEIVGNLVVTDLQKYLEKPVSPLSANGEAIADELNELSKVIPYDFNRVRRSVIDAYEGIYSFLILYLSYSFNSSCINGKRQEIREGKIRKI
jgi:hypothetical protein